MIKYTPYTGWKTDNEIDWNTKKISVLLIIFESGKKIVLLYPKENQEYNEFFDHLGEKIESVETIDAYDFWNV